MAKVDVMVKVYGKDATLAAVHGPFRVDSTENWEADAYEAMHDEVEIERPDQFFYAAYRVMGDAEESVTELPTTLVLMDLATDDKRQWTVRVVFEGDCYGLDNILIHDDPSPLVEFYDRKSTKFGKLGQFVSRYYLSTLLADKAALSRRGLDLQMDVKAWKLGRDTIATAINWAEGLAEVAGVNTAKLTAEVESFWE